MLVILPGLIGVAFYLLAIAVVVQLRPRDAPNEGELLPVSRSDVHGMIAVVTLFLVIIVGIYGGILSFWAADMFRLALLLFLPALFLVWF